MNVQKPVQFLTSQYFIQPRSETVPSYRNSERSRRITS